MMQAKQALKVKSVPSKAAASSAARNATMTSLPRFRSVLSQRRFWFSYPPTHPLLPYLSCLVQKATSFEME